MRWDEIPPATEPSKIRLGVIGDPIEHSLSPKMHQAALDALGINADYYGIQVPPADLEPAIRHLAEVGFTGLNVTIPHKQDKFLLHSGDAIAKSIGAANTIRFQEGEIECTNTDAEGFFSPICSYPKGKALILGAGGAAAATANALDNNGWNFCVWSRTSEKARTLAEKYDAEVRFEPSPRGCSLVVNATPVGLIEGDEPPLIWKDLAEDAAVYDLVYRPGPTDFLAHALLHGARIIDGREMLVGQGAVSFKWWLKIEPPVEVMRKAVGL